VVATAVGTALHLAFEVGDEAPDFAAASRWLEGSLSPAQLPKAQAAMDETIAALGGGKLLERFQAIHPHILGREVDLLLKAEADTDEPISAYSGSIDLLYTDPVDGAIVVADYKTDRVAVSELSAQSEHHQAQGQLYLRAAQAAFPDAPSCRFELWFLNHDCII
jgi:ATP-dependent exoDNAse (exonuclease V) beta subunit